MLQLRERRDDWQLTAVDCRQDKYWKKASKNYLGFRNLLWKLKAVNQFRNIVSGVLVTLRAASHPGSSAKKVPVPEMLGNHTLPKEDLEVFHAK